MNKIKVLLIEDDRSISNFITATMDREGYKIMHALNGREGLSLSTSFCPNVILLDLGLPDMDGLEVLQKLRSWSDVPVIIISARTKEQEKVSALDLGADDYISKPFRPRELVSRIGVVLRRSGKASAVLESGGITIDTGKAVVKRDGNEIFLSALEYRILLILFQNKGMILSREKLLEAIWDVAGDFVNDNTLTVYIKRLREKIEKEPAKPEIIKTIRGMGYGVF